VAGSLQRTTGPLTETERIGHVKNLCEKYSEKEQNLAEHALLLVLIAVFILIILTLQGTGQQVNAMIDSIFRGT